MSKGLNAEFAYSMELTAVINHHPCNLILSFLRLSSNAVSYSSSTSSYAESIEKRLLLLICPFSYHSSSFLIIIRFLRRLSLSERRADGPTPPISPGGTSPIFINPSHVLVLPILSTVECPKRESFFSISSTVFELLVEGVLFPNPNILDAKPVSVFVSPNIEDEEDDAFAFAFDPPNIFTFLLPELDPESSFNSFSRRSKSPKSILILLEALRFLSFINNSIPGPKLEDEPDDREFEKSSAKFKEIGSKSPK